MNKLVLAAIVIFYSNATLAAECAEPKAFVEASAAEITQVMRDSGISPDAKHQKIAALFEQHVDFPWMAKYILGEDWASLNAAQQTQFIKTYHDFIISTYSGKLDNYTGHEKVTASKVAPLKDGESFLVTATILNSPGDEDEFSVMLRKSSDCYKIDDLVSDGVSLLKIEKQDFSSIFKQQGFKGLIDILNQKMSQNKAG